MNRARKRSCVTTAAKRTAPAASSSPPPRCRSNAPTPPAATGEARTHAAAAARAAASRLGATAACHAPAPAVLFNREREHPKRQSCAENDFVDSFATEWCCTRSSSSPSIGDPLAGVGFGSGSAEDCVQVEIILTTGTNQCTIEEKLQSRFLLCTESAYRKLV